MRDMSHLHREIVVHLHKDTAHLHLHIMHADMVHLETVNILAPQTPLPSIQARIPDMGLVAGLIPGLILVLIPALTLVLTLALTLVLTLVIPLIVLQ